MMAPNVCALALDGTTRNTENNNLPVTAWPMQTLRQTRKTVNQVFGVTQSLRLRGNGGTGARMRLQLKATHRDVHALEQLSARAHAATSTGLLQMARRSVETLKESGLDRVVTLTINLKQLW